MEGRRRALRAQCARHPGRSQSGPEAVVSHAQTRPLERAQRYVHRPGSSSFFFFGWTPSIVSRSPIVRCELLLISGAIIPKKIRESKQRRTWARSPILSARPAPARASSTLSSPSSGTPSSVGGGADGTVVLVPVLVLAVLPRARCRKSRIFSRRVARRWPVASDWLRFLFLFFFPSFLFSYLDGRQVMDIWRVKGGFVWFVVILCCRRREKKLNTRK